MEKKHYGETPIFSLNKKGGVTMEFYKGYKIRIYPTKEQEVLLWKHIGCCRFVWNWMLELQKNEYKQNKKHLSTFDVLKKLTDLKKEYDWLYEVSNKSL